jgi:signal transduction histidine kinase
MRAPKGQKKDESSLAQSSLDLMSVQDAVFNIWESETCARIPGARSLRHSILINTFPLFFDNLAKTLTPSYQRVNATSGSTVARSHGDERARLSPYGPAEIILEYQILEESIVTACARGKITLSNFDWDALRRSVDVATFEAVREFTRSQGASRDRLAAALAHDMRNPLSGMCLRAQLLARPNMPEKVRDLARKINENGERLGAMFDELLDALAYGGGARLPLRLSSFDMLEMAREACAQVSETNQAQCGVTGESIRGVWCANSMRRALDNLISNAIKYGDGGAVAINVSTWSDRVWLSVHNSGESVPEDQVGHLFEYLRREATRSLPGWGIGLPFVRKVAESHGGSITIDSAPERGTTFTIDIPLDARDVKPKTDQATP